MDIRTKMKIACFVLIGAVTSSIAVTGCLNVVEIDDTDGGTDTDTDTGDGSYQWHTFYGGMGNDAGFSIAVDGTGNLFVSGYSGNSWDGPSGQSPLHAHSGHDANADIFVLKLDSSGSYQWHTFYPRRGGGMIDVDDAGNLFVSGSSEYSWDGPSGQSPLNAFSEDDTVFVLKLNSSGAYQWHTFCGKSDEGVTFAIDGAGNLFMTGISWNSWDGPSGQSPLHAHIGEDAEIESHQIFVLKLDSSGAYQWHTFYESDAGRSIAFDGTGNIFVAGNSWGSWDGPSGQSPLNAHSGEYNITVIKLDSSGEYQWHTFYPQWGGFPISIAYDGTANLYVTGYAPESWTGPSGQSPLNAHSGYDEAAIIKLDSSGAYQWHTFYPWMHGEGSLAVDESGNLYATGTSGFSWDGPSGQSPLNAYSKYNDILVLKLDSNGTYQWHTFYGGDGESESGYSIAVDGTGNLFVTGWSRSFDGPSGQSPLNNAYSGDELRDIFILKLTD